MNSPECRDDVCVTCSDEGRPGVVVRLGEGPGQPATVRTEAGDEDVDLTLVSATPGDVVLVHAGLALTVLPREGGGAA